MRLGWERCDTMPAMQIFHIATAADWAAARAAGHYSTSTLGRSLAEEGFIHAAKRDQLEGVYAAYYRDTPEPLTLLTIDTDRLDVPWRYDQVGDDAFPHIYGPLPVTAVVRTQDLKVGGGAGSFTAVFLHEMLLRAFLALGAMALAGAGSVLGDRLGDRLGTDWGGFVGALAGLAIGLAVMVLVLRRRA